MSVFLAAVPEGLPDKTELRQLLIKWKKTLQQQHKETRWTPPDLWHVTINYLGKLSAEEKAKAVEALRGFRLARSEPVKMRLQGVGAFPRSEEGRVLWLGVQRSQELLDLQTELANKWRELGFWQEDRDFVPHLTLARFRNLMNVTSLVQLGGRKHFGDYAIKELILFESVPQGAMMKYIPLERVRLFDLT